ncbi:hypothetical protein ACS3QZ_19580 (plasmid) [Shimia sp. W99]
MAKLFIHIGSHKTGTSYLQELFNENRDRLKKAGVHYPVIGPNNAHHALAAAWMHVSGLPDGFFTDTGPNGLWNRLVGEYAKGEGTVFLSAENFSRVFPDRVDMADLRRRVAAFDEVKVIYTMRRQAELIQSVWMQVALTRRPPSLRKYLEIALKKRRGGGVPLDHGMFYDNMRNGFSADEITLLDYAQIRRTEGGIAQTFLDLLGADLKAADLTPPDAKAANVSPDPLATYAASMIVPDRPTPEDLIQLAGKVLRPDSGIPATLLARHEYAKFNTRYRPGNASLVERVQSAQPGFTFEEQDPPENMIYRDDMTTQSWISISAELYARQAASDQKIWRKRAKSLF